MENLNNKKSISFKEYNFGQGQLFPQNISDLIPENHLVRIINNFIEQMDLTPLLEKYKGGGCSSYHPKMMLKILIYAYSQKTYSSRLIAKALSENINFMWLCAGNKPDFRTINRFRSSHLKGLIEKIFTSVIEFLLEKKYIKLENYFLDGTKIEANANKYTFVWKKSTKRYQASLQDKIKELLKQIEKENDDENDKYGDKDLEEKGENSHVSSEELEEAVRQLNEKLKKNPNNKELKKAKKIIENDYLPRTKKYEDYEQIFNGRNSFSKTDHDATFMRMKDDHMRNGQLKASYNVQIGTENQFVVGFSIGQKPVDTSLFISHLNILNELLGKFPKNVVADAGYGSEENYEYLNQNELGNYVKFNYFHQEQKKKFKENIFRVENLKYDEYTDMFICPNEKQLFYKETIEYKTANGYSTSRRVYECESCDECNLRDKCHRSKYHRKIHISHKLNEYKNQARLNLKSEKGLELRSKRPIEPESVFGHIKSNRGFNRFLLRGLEKVKIEWGLLCIAHNMIKLSVLN